MLVTGTCLSEERNTDWKAVVARSCEVRERDLHTNKDKDERTILPVIEVPETIHKGMSSYHSVLIRLEGFGHISRHVTRAGGDLFGLGVSPS
jgi:hypothetical protein